MTSWIGSIPRGVSPTRTNPAEAGYCCLNSCITSTPAAGRDQFIVEKDLIVKELAFVFEYFYRGIVALSRHRSLVLQM